VKRERNLFGEYMKGLRIEAGLSIEEAATKLKVSSQTICDWRNFDS